MVYKLRGNWSVHSKYGEQFAFLWHELMQPQDTEGIFKYIVSVCKWVGPTVASQIVEKYGDDTLNVLKESPSKVALEIKGLTKERAKDIQIALSEYEEVEAVVVALEKIFAPIEGIPKRLAFECADFWKANAVVRLTENPYLLTRIKGIGFPTADKVGLALGIDSKAKFRQQACIVHLITENMHEGHVWIAHTLLVEKVIALIGLCEDDVIEGLLDDYTIFKKNDCYGLHELVMNEDLIVEKLISIFNCPFEMMDYSREALPWD
jgi:exodeoxyribonuclease V alpha subunit